MAKMILQLISTSYRAVLEEQDDTILWLTHALKNAGTHSSIVLEESATNYVVTNQRVPTLEIGSWHQTHPPDLCEDLSRLMTAGVAVYVIKEDAELSGIKNEQILPGVQLLPRNELSKMISEHDFTWRW